MESEAREQTVTRAGAIQAASCDELSCNAPATCELREDAPSCVCPSGSRLATDGRGCEDIDECKEASTHDCDVDADGKNRERGYDCTCREGYAGDGRSCVAADSCKDDQTSCHADAQCTTREGAAGCQCRKGFEGDGRSCTDVDECQGDNATCAENARCSNRRGSFACSCEPPFEGDGAMRCQDACEIAKADPERCDADGHGLCSIDASGRASCTQCQSGYLGDGRRCTANDECAKLGCGEHTVCAGEPGKRRCECAAGYAGDARAGCEDVDECAKDAPCQGENTRCVNAAGGYVCSCADGFERRDGACVNVDECANKQALCDPAATCRDENPGYRCECKKGYEGDGRTCTDIDECARDSKVCADAAGTVCRNTAGGHECTCPKGFTSSKQDGCICDLSGYWGARIDTKVELNQLSAGDVVLISAMQMRSYVWELHRYRYDGQALQIEKKSCGMSDDAEIYSPLYDEVYSLAIPHASYDKLGFDKQRSVPLQSGNALPGKDFETPREAVMQGIKLDDDLNDPWPKSVKDVPADAWTDFDKDGAPGLTFWPASTTRRTRRGTDETYSYLPVELKSGSSLVGSRVGCISVGVRSVQALKGRFDSCRRISGHLDIERFDVRVQGCTVIRMSDWDTSDVSCSVQDWEESRRCTAEQVQFIDEQDLPRQTGGELELVKLGEADATDIDCAKVRAALPALPRR